MQQMIKAYEASRKKIEKRVHELTAALRDPSLRTQEREQLEIRRELLTAERVELLHMIREMQQHLTETTEEEKNGRTCRDTETGIRQSTDTGHAVYTDQQSGTAGNSSAGAA